MRKIIRVGAWILGSLAVLFAIWFILVLRADPGERYIERSVDASAHHFEAASVYVASDADMVGTAYVDGILHPLPEAHDAISRIDLETGGVESAATTVSNSVTAWPGTLELAPDARHAYVIESRGPAPERVQRVGNVHKDLKEGRRLTTLEIGLATKPRVVREDDIAIDPTSVAVAPNGNWLAVSARDDQFPITFALLSGGVPSSLRHPSLQLPVLPALPAEATSNESFAGVGYLRISPDGRSIAVHLQSLYVMFGEVIFDDTGEPVDIHFGAPLRVGKFLSVGRWSLDGHHYVLSDTDWGVRPADTLRAGRGQLISIRVDGLQGTVVSTAKVSLSPEGMEMSRDGTLFVTVNMERTYLPDRFPYSFMSRTREASLSLVTFDATTGSLKTVDGPVAFDAVLPEDAIFDRNANMLAVAIFNDRTASPIDGWIELFAIDRTGGTPQVRPAGKRLRMPRGVHDLAVVY